MTSLLEKAMQAACCPTGCVARKFDDLDACQSNCCVGTVRAVLGAVRDLDHDATAAVVRPGDDRTKAVRDFQAIIDAILAEGKT